MGDGELKSRDIVLYLIGRCQDRPEFGRTSLQKVAYFVGRGTSRDLGHVAYYYGPFSSGVERETEALVLSDLVEERVHSLGFATTSGFEAKQYDYKLTQAGNDRVHELIERHPLETKSIDAILNALLDQVGGLDQRELSAAAKVDYIASRQDRAVGLDDVGRAAKDLGWRLTEDQVEGVMHLLERLGLGRIELSDA